MIEKNIKLNRTIPLVLMSLLLLTSITAVNAEQPTTSPNTNTLNDQSMRPQFQVTTLNGENKILRDNILAFLNNVAKLDIEKYDITVHIDETPGRNYDKSMNFRLRSADNHVDISCLIKDNVMFWCAIYPVRGQPIYTTTTDDTLSNAKDALAELSAFLSKSYMPTIQEMLNNITEIENSKNSNTEFTQTITIRTDNHTRLMWEPFANGLSHSQNQLSLEYTDGQLSFFCNYLGMFTIGTSEVAISEQEAIQRAIEHVQAYFWTQADEVVSNVTVLEHLIRTKLTLELRDDTTLYPFWEIRLGLDKMYPGGATGFQVMMWADTGEISYITPIGSYTAPSDASGSSPENASPQQSQPQTNTYTLVIVLALIAIVATTTGYLAHKRKK